MVLGGGIGGIEASLDLAESGFKVYLVDESPSIGGVMALLDKTFPTNDCSMCILAPKLVEAGRHHNIELLTYADLEKVEGEAGSFRVTIRKKSRYVDVAKCTGCADCVEVCPVEISNEYEQALVNRKAIYRPFPQAIPNAFTIQKTGVPPCRHACPAGVNIQGYVALIGRGKYREAVELIREKNPFPSICGRVCPHPCESQCNRKDFDEAVAINALKRFATEKTAEEEVTPEPPEITKKEKIAIVGGGPAGLTAAYYLGRMGYATTIFEKLPELGGMLYAGIPEYRLPRDVLKKEIEYIIKSAGAEVRTGVEIGKDVGFDRIRNDYDAVYIASGAHESMKLDIPGEDQECVLHGVDFLRDLHLGRDVALGEKVAVIGGGDVAIDSARCALRLGCREVSIVYRRSRAEMPANDMEIKAAGEEGINLIFLAAPTRVLGGGGKVNALECVRMELGEPDESGRRRPVPIEGSEFTLEVDTLIPAIGQSSDTSFLRDAVEVSRRGRVPVGDSLVTSDEKVFAGGDVVVGPATVIEAVAAGRKAAESIDRCLRGVLVEAEPAGEIETLTINDLDTCGIERRARPAMPELPADRRTADFTEVELGLTEEQALEEAKRCLNCGTCCECMQCVAACKAEAIDHRMTEENIEVDVGSIIVTSGFKEFDAGLLGEYGFGRYPNVITSSAFERVLNASGPYGGKVLRPSDGAHPTKIAWIQCVGSRDERHPPSYCSGVCCMYATKEAVIAKEHAKDVQPTIFFMDMRAYGKGFDEYYERAKGEYGVRYIRAIPSSVREVPGTRNLRITYLTEEGELEEEEFEMVVLTVGLRPPENAAATAGKLGIELNKYGFCAVGEWSPLETTVPGIYVAGAFSGPKDIPETVIQAGGAAASASALLSDARNTLVTRKEYVPEIDVAGRLPRIGVFVCECGINIGGVVNVPEVAEFARGLSGVVHAEYNMFTCSQDSQVSIKKAIEEHRLNRVVVASCTPRTHEALFRETVREAGLNPYLFEMANIRDQCSWVHMHQPLEATEKAKIVVTVAVSKSRLLTPLYEESIGVTRKGLVVGGGIAGMTASRALAEQGYEVFLVEREKNLGGNLRHIHYTIDGKNARELLEKTVKRVNADELIHVYTDATVKEINGYVGNFETVLEAAGEEIEVEHGVVIVATGAVERRPDEYLYGASGGVITQRELEERLAGGREVDADTIVMIQCVGSRDDERPYCSRFCCSQAVKNAILLKERNPGVDVYVLYRDMRTYGFREEYYRRAREMGVRFVRYEPERKPQVVERDGKLTVDIFDRVLRENVSVPADLVVLSPGVVAEKSNEELSRMLKVPRTRDGFFLEAHVKLRPVDFATEGIFLCGLAHSPACIDESIAQAQAAAARAGILLSKDRIRAKGIVVGVDEELCSGCGVCVEICDYGALSIDEETGKARVTEVLCQGCGACAAACPNGANQQRAFNREQMLRQIEAAVG